MNAMPPSEDADLRPGKGRADENFPVGSHLIARRLRRHVHAYYDFVRAADDVSDSAELSPEEKIRRLDLMEAALRGAPGATSSSAARLRPTLAATGLPPELATDLLIAFRRDATVLRTPDWAALLDYCRYSANPVGRFLLALHGENETTYAASDALCTSLQILNHLQDCAEDFRLLDRSYLPGDMLADADITAGEVLQHRTRPALRHVFDRILDRVDRLNVEAARLPGLVRNRRMRIEAAVIVGLAHRLAARLRVEDPLAGPRQAPARRRARVAAHRLAPPADPDRAARLRARRHRRGRGDRGAGRHLVRRGHAHPAGRPAARDARDLRVLPHRRRHRR